MPWEWASNKAGQQISTSNCKELSKKLYKLFTETAVKINH